METLYIYHHLGLGDHIICNAIVRNYAKQNDIVLFVKPHNFENVQYMYRDLKNIDYIIGDDSVAEKFITDNNITNLLKIGFDKLDYRYKFDEAFYRQIGMDFEKKWTDFYLERNEKAEKEALKWFGFKEGEYIFINEDPSRGFTMGRYRKDLPIINSNNPFPLFDLCYVIENAAEIHLMESSIKCLVEHLDLKTDKLFYHSYMRNYPPNIQVTSKRKWTIL